jgi:tRNA A-37 threonylcarbamoyl transferase component Bud32
VSCTRSRPSTRTWREYRLLRDLAELNVPAVHVVGIVVDRGPDLEAILVTRFLDYSTTYRALFSSSRGGQPTDRLLDALVELLVRLHLSGFFWGDCSLSNTLFRYDAGTLEAYLVDAETSERHPSLTAGQRRYDVDLAEERVYGELLEHRWYMSEAAGFDVGTAAAARSYFQTVLPGVPELLSEGGSAPGGAGTSS